MLDFLGENKKIRDFLFFCKKRALLPIPKGVGFPCLKFIMNFCKKYKKKRILKGFS